MGPEASPSKAPCGASIYVVCAAVHSAASRIGEPNCSRGISFPHVVHPATGSRAKSSKYGPPNNRWMRCLTAAGFLLCSPTGAITT